MNQIKNNKKLKIIKITNYNLIVNNYYYCKMADFSVAFLKAAKLIKKKKVKFDNNAFCCLKHQERIKDLWYKDAYHTYNESIERIKYILANYKAETTIISKYWIFLKVLHPMIVYIQRYLIILNYNNIKFSKLLLTKDKNSKLYHNLSFSIKSNNLYIKNFIAFLEICHDTPYRYISSLNIPLNMKLLFEVMKLLINIETAKQVKYQGLV